MFRGVVILALLAGLALPATAAAARPGVTTGGTANLTDTTVSLNGSVNPRGKATQYYFQFGLEQALRRCRPPATGGRRRERRLGGQRPGRRPRAGDALPLPDRRGQRRRHHGSAATGRSRPRCSRSA